MTVERGVCLFAQIVRRWATQQADGQERFARGFSADAVVDFGVGRASAVVQLVHVEGDLLFGHGQVALFFNLREFLSLQNPVSVISV